LSPLFIQRQGLAIVRLGAVIISSFLGHAPQAIEDDSLAFFIPQLTEGVQGLMVKALGLVQVAALLGYQAAHTGSLSSVAAVSPPRHRFVHAAGPGGGAVGLGTVVMNPGHVVGAPASPRPVLQRLGRLVGPLAQARPFIPVTPKLEKALQGIS
jgi:hypothetical protein